MRLNSVLDISRNQGTFEIHMESFKLTKEVNIKQFFLHYFRMFSLIVKLTQGHSLLSCKHGEPGSLYFNWRFYNLDVDSRTNLQKGPTYAFQSASVYLVDIRSDFLKYIKTVKYATIFFMRPISIKILKSFSCHRRSSWKSN